MLYLLRNLRTTLHFSESEIDKVGSQKKVWAKLRQKIQGKCTNQCGVIVNIPKPQLDSGNPNTILPLARIDQRGGCSFQIEFSAIGFKAEKNDLLKVKVNEVECDYIGAMVGPIQIKIPNCKIDPQFEYDKSLNCYRLIGKNYKIELGDVIYCKCLQSRVYQGSDYRIIGEIPACLIPLIVALR